MKKSCSHIDNALAPALYYAGFVVIQVFDFSNTAHVWEALLCSIPVEAIDGELAAPQEVSVFFIIEDTRVSFTWKLSPTENKTSNSSFSVCTQYFCLFVFTQFVIILTLIEQ